MSNYFVITDEAGAYKQQAQPKFRQSHPFYIRSNVVISTDDYRVFQNEMQRLNAMYEIPIDEEIKWADLWSKYKGNPRTPTVRKMSEDRLKGYYRQVFKLACQKESLEFIFTVTNVFQQYCLLAEHHVYKFHLQDVFQRVQMDMKKDDFAIFIMDELNHETVNQIKDVCHELIVTGDFVKYKNQYAGVLTENSLYSPGIQLSDYVAGVLFGYVRGALMDRGNYAYATDLYNDYVAGRIRHHANGARLGYGVIEIPKHPQFRAELNPLFDV